jgi:hypothetical protein
MDTYVYKYIHISVCINARTSTVETLISPISSALLPIDLKYFTQSIPLGGCRDDKIK